MTDYCYEFLLFFSWNGLAILVEFYGTTFWLSICEGLSWLKALKLFEESFKLLFMWVWKGLSLSMLIYLLVALVFCLRWFLLTWVAGYFYLSPKSSKKLADSSRWGFFSYWGNSTFFCYLKSESLNISLVFSCFSLTFYFPVAEGSSI